VLIKEKFGVEYSMKHVRELLRRFGMRFGKPYPHDYRRPKNADDDLKKLTLDEGDIVGFIDKASPQTTANTQRLWSFRKPEIVKNTTKFRANTFGFYSLNGRSAVDFHENSRKEDIMDFLSLIRRRNPDGRIVAIIDNFKPYHSPETSSRQFLYSLNQALGTTKYKKR